jgi:hypothetical protein
VSLLIMDGIPFLYLTDRFLEPGGDISTDGERDPAEAFMQFSLLAPVAIGHKLMLVACRIGAKTDRLYSGREKREGMQNRFTSLVIDLVGYLYSIILISQGQRGFSLFLMGD